MCFAAFASLAEEDAIEVESALVGRLASADWRRRRAACEALGARARSPGTVEAVAALLEDPSPFVVAAACRALGRLDAVAFGEAVARVLGRADQDVRLAAVEALCTLGDAGTLDVLFRVMSEDASEAVRRQAAFALHDRSTHANWRALFDRWCTDTLARHRVWACDLAARFGDEACVPVLVALTGDHDGHVRVAAGKALARVHQGGR
jgi:HEAT repeat protein